MAALGTDLTARLHHAAGGEAADTCQLEKNHLHRTGSKNVNESSPALPPPPMEASSGLREAWNY